MGPNMQLPRAELRSKFASGLPLGNLPREPKEARLPGREPATVNGFDRCRANHLECIKKRFSLNAHGHKTWVQQRAWV